MDENFANTGELCFILKYDDDFNFWQSDMSHLHKKFTC